MAIDRMGEILERLKRIEAMLKRKQRKRRGGGWVERCKKDMEQLFGNTTELPAARCIGVLEGVHGHSRLAIYQAKQQLGIVSYRAGNRQWVWKWPA